MQPSLWPFMTTSYSAQQKQHTTSHLKPRLRSFIAAREEQAFLSSRVSWWHARRGFIFCAFAPRDALRLNWAEVIHTGWVYRDRPNLSMLDICLVDTRDSFFPDIELRDCQSVAALGGKGPSYADRKKKKHARNVNKAKPLGQEMFPDEECTS